MKHHLKIWTKYYDEVAQGRMPYQLRPNDRGFAVGDEVELQEFRPGAGAYTDRRITGTICYVMKPEDELEAWANGLRTGWCCFGITNIKEITHHG